MRHRRAGWKLGRNTEHRRALLRNLVTSLIVEERIETTLTKAKAMRPHVEKMITLGKRGDVAARRQALSYLMTREAVDKLFDKISPRYGDRNGGYLRIIHGGFRQGDGGDIAFVELLGSEATLDEKRTKRNEARAKRAEENKKAMEAATAETAAAEGETSPKKSSFCCRETRRARRGCAFFVYASDNPFLVQMCRPMSACRLLPLQVHLMHRAGIEHRLHQHRSSGIEGDVLPAAGARGEAGLVKFVERGSDNRKEDSDHGPLPMPEIAKENSPSPLQSEFQTRAVRVLQGAENQQAQDGIANEVT